jgi:WD40 repeat protein
VLAFSSDGNELVSGSEDKKLCVYDTGDGALLENLKLPFGPTAAAFSADGRQIFIITARIRSRRTRGGFDGAELRGAGDTDLSYFAWRHKGAKLAEVGRAADRHGKKFTAIAVSSDTGQVFIGGTVLWRVDAGTGRMLSDLMSAEQAEDLGVATALTFAGQTLVSGHRDGELAFRDITSGTPTITEEGFKSVAALAWLPAADLLLIACYDNSVVAWRASDQTVVARTRLDVPLTSLVPIASSSCAVSLDEDGMLARWDARDLSQPTVAQAAGPTITAIAGSRTENRLAIGDEDGGIRIVPVDELFPNA